MVKLWLSVFLLGFFVCIDPFCRALAGNGPGGPVPGGQIYTEDRVSFQVLGGSLFSSDSIGPDAPSFNYAQANLRMGWMLNTPGAWRYVPGGNLEVLLELTNSAIYKGPGDYMGGLRTIMRYNLVRPDWSFTPYFQVGLGIIYNDAYKDRTQDAIGKSIEFAPNAGLGCRYLISRKWSIDAEAVYEHISNAGRSHRNDGMNSFGGFIGVTHFFDRLWR
jgi:hypothetical protein